MMSTMTLDPEVLTTARETASNIQSDPRMAVIGYDKRLLIESLTREIEQINDRILAKRQERAIWMNELPEKAYEHADDNDWCEQFDRAMEAAGLPPRRARRETITVYGTIIARVEVDVRSLVENEYDDYDVDEVDDYTTYATIVLDDDCYVEVEVDSGDCGCGEVDEDPSSGDLHRYSSKADRFDDEHSGASYTFTPSSCSNC